MAQVKEISVGVSFLKSLPNYQNIRFEASAVYTLEAGEDPKKVYKQAWDTVGDQIEEQVKLFEEEDKSTIKKGLK